jgi:rsbT co-antagonist protein RsbR
LSSIISEIVDKSQHQLLEAWMHFQREKLGNRQDRVSDAQLRANSEQFLASLRTSLNSGSTNIRTPEWARTRELLGDLSHQRATQGFSPTETATFVFSFKQALLPALQAQLAKDPDALVQESYKADELLDQLGLYTTEVYQKSREQVINRQQQEMMELSTPVVELWEGILALPLIGTLDSNRTQIVMQNLLEAIVRDGADLAIIDITGVPTVDTLVAQHLLKTVAAARLMGADCIISGIRPQIAQTIIHLGVDLSGVLTKATLVEAFRLALKKKSLTITKV